MGAPDTVPNLVLSHPDGTPLTRIEADQHIRNELRKVHFLRILANKRYGLPKQFTFGMVELMVRHWFLDEAIRRGEVVGDLVGVDLQNHNDESATRQFTQRLAAMIQAGQAVQPKEGEGIDMTNIPQPIPGAPNNGQGFIPPPPPPMGMNQPPQGYAPPPPPQGYAPPPPPPPQGYSPPPQQPQGYAPPQSFAPPQGPPQMPPQDPPMMLPGYTPPVGTAPMMPPQMTPTQASPGRRGRKAAEPPQNAGGFVPPMTQQTFLPLPLPPQIAATQQAPQTDLGPLVAKIDQLHRQITMANLAITALSRAVYSRNGTAEIEGWLKELGIQLPQ